MNIITCLIILWRVLIGMMPMRMPPGLANDSLLKLNGKKQHEGQMAEIFPGGNEWDTARCNLSGEPKPVGNVEAGKSVYGCYDMAGSVYEWCADWYQDTYYAEAPSRNPKGPDKSAKRVIREARDSQNHFKYKHTRENPNSRNCSIWRWDFAVQRM